MFDYFLAFISFNIIKVQLYYDVHCILVDNHIEDNKSIDNKHLLLTSQYFFA